MPMSSNHWTSGFIEFSDCVGIALDKQQPPSGSGGGLNPTSSANSTWASLIFHGRVEAPLAMRALTLVSCSSDKPHDSKYASASVKVSTSAEHRRAMRGMRNLATGGSGSLSPAVSQEQAPRLDSSEAAAAPA
eukprot:CAMPEP_0177465472 /NCGR_PEP_ID=MMETSP0369-20130122/17431_1 /TAXON_ID=447022 ORGANISM="Scrippsiella hangoei-like, Strain SHHI-4" /NCGR_SAMPLE_ID=MMETSP0369 /ASSEMBLY_ACC=CAM_ASM_000364 /LENGTH=132 /DNA_ID=CAMNT_0018939357 /DNA_START=208 /DNA_END=605 /DNA_ORIENTATION=+